MRDKLAYAKSKVALQGLSKYLEHSQARVIRDALVIYYHQVFGLDPFGDSLEVKSVKKLTRRRVYQDAYSKSYRANKNNIIKNNGGISEEILGIVRFFAREAGNDAVTKYDQEHDKQ